MKWKLFVLIMVCHEKLICLMVIQRVLFLLLLPKPRVSLNTHMSNGLCDMTQNIWLEIITNFRGGQSYWKFEQKTFPWTSSNCWKMGWPSKLWNRGKWRVKESNRDHRNSIMDRPEPLCHIQDFVSKNLRLDDWMTHNGSEIWTRIKVVKSFEWTSTLTIFLGDSSRNRKSWFCLEGVAWRWWGRRRLKISEIYTWNHCP